MWSDFWTRSARSTRATGARLRSRALSAAPPLPAALPPPRPTSRELPPPPRPCRSNVVDKLRLIKGKRNKAEERDDLLTQRAALKDDFIAKKQAARANISLVKAKVESLGVVKEMELKELQDDFREVDAEFKELGVTADRDELFGNKGRGLAGDENDPSKMNNTQLLGKALDVQKANKEKLKEGLQTVIDTKTTAMETAAILEQDREKINVSARAPRPGAQRRWRVRAAAPTVPRHQPPSPISPLRSASAPSWTW